MKRRQSGTNHRARSRSSRGIATWLGASIVPLLLIFVLSWQTHGMTGVELALQDGAPPATGGPAAAGPAAPGPVAPGPVADELDVADDPVEPASPTEEVTQGALRIEGEDGQYIECPLKHTDVRAEISGFIARVNVTQTFQNPTDKPIEAVYVFPLPNESAVDNMTMVIGDRRIVGEIQKKDDARRIYEMAIAAGQTAALLEQDRPNIFTQTVGNIEPGEEVEIEISYVDVLKYDMGIYEFHFPMVVGPRYNPSGPDAVPDRERLEFPVLGPDVRTGHDISLQLSLDAGVPIQDVTAVDHEVFIGTPSDTRASVSLSPRDTVPNKDFVLRYKVVGEKPEIAVLSHTSADAHDARRLGEGYFMLMIQPSEEKEELAQTPPREIVFLIDVSGSMRGAKTDQVKACMTNMLGLCRDEDRFQVVTFASQAHKLFEAPVDVNAKNIEDALAFNERSTSGGGTQMLDGIKLAMDAPIEDDRMRIVVLLSDGFIGNEAQIIEHVGETCGDQIRFWAVGVDASPNMHLIDGVARQGGGMGKRLSPGESAEPLTSEIMSRIQRAQLTKVKIDFGDLDVAQTYPAEIPELWAGRPIVMFGRYTEGGESNVVVSGKVEGQPVSWSVDLSLAGEEPDHDVLAKTWARQKIESLMHQSFYAGSPAIEEEVTALALNYRLMSPYTSFVAVDTSEMVNPGAEAPIRVRVPVPLPAYNDWDGYFGDPSITMIEAGDDDSDAIMLFSQSAPAPQLSRRPLGVRGVTTLEEKRSEVDFVRQSLESQTSGRGYGSGFGGPGAGGPANRFSGGGGLRGGGIGGGGGGFASGGIGFGGDSSGLELSMNGAYDQFSSAYGAVPAQSNYFRSTRGRRRSLAANESIVLFEAEYGYRTNANVYFEQVYPAGSPYQTISAEYYAADFTDVIPQEVESLLPLIEKQISDAETHIEAEEWLEAEKCLIEAIYLAMISVRNGEVVEELYQKAIELRDTVREARLNELSESFPNIHDAANLMLRDAGLIDALNAWSQSTGIPVEIVETTSSDLALLLQSNIQHIDYADLREVTALDSLTWLLDNFQLDYVIDNECIVIGTTPRLRSSASWVYNLTPFVVPTFDELEAVETEARGEFLLANSQDFIAKMKEACELSDGCRMTWLAPGHVLVMGDKADHARIAAHFAPFTAGEFDAESATDEWQKLIASRFTDRWEAREAIDRQRFHQSMLVNLETEALALITAAATGELDLEALTYLQMAWKELTKEGFDERGVAAKYQFSAWLIAESSRALPDESELQELASRVLDLTTTSAEMAFDQFKEDVNNHELFRSVVFAALARGVDSDYAQAVKEDLFAARIAQPTLMYQISWAVFHPHDETIESVLTEMAELGPSSVAEGMMLALMCHHVQGEPLDMFRRESPGYLGKFEPSGNLVVFASRLPLGYVNLLPMDAVSTGAQSQ